MQGQIIVDVETGRRSLYVPQAHIQIATFAVGDRWLIAAFRTDGEHRPIGEQTSIPTEEWLKSTHQFTTETDVPEHIVAFAVESERQRQEFVDDTIDDLEATIMNADLFSMGAEITIPLIPDQPAEEKEVEHQIALEINKLMTEAGGLH